MVQRENTSGYALIPVSDDAQLSHFCWCTGKQELCFSSSDILGQLMRLFGKEILAGFKQWGQVYEVLMLISGWRLVQRSRATEVLGSAVDISTGSTGWKYFVISNKWFEVCVFISS